MKGRYSILPVEFSTFRSRQGRMRQVLHGYMRLWFFVMLWLCVGQASVQAEDTFANNEIAFLIRVERDGRLWALSEIPSLEYGDLLHVRLVNAKGYHPKFPHVANQRVYSMANDHGFMVVGAFVRPTDRSGLGSSAFVRPFLSPDGDELLFRVERDDVTPFLLIIPAIYDGNREGEWKDFVNDVVRKPELKGLRDFLLREFASGTAGGEFGLVFKEGDDPDNTLRTAQFLLPRIAAANDERNKPEFQQLTRSQQTERLYNRLGVDLPDRADSYEYINQFLDAFVSNDPNQPVRLPNTNTLGNLLQDGLSFLPAWYNAPLRGLELFGKLTLMVSGLNQRPKPDEKYFVSVRWSPSKPKALPTGAGAAEVVIGNTFLMEPIERLEVRGGDGRRRKNVLIASLGRTGFRQAVVKPTIAVPNRGGVVYLSNASQVRTLGLDNSSPLSPDELHRFAGETLKLHIADGGEPIPLRYDPRTGQFALLSARPLPLNAVNAVIKGDWGHNGKTEDLSAVFQVRGVEPGTWSVENAGLMMAGGNATLRLRTDKPVEPWKVVFRYANGAQVTTQEVAPVPNEPGVYTARFDLSQQRAGVGRLEIYKPPMETPPDVVEKFASAEGTELRLQVFDPINGLGANDLEYFAYDPQLRLKSASFTPNNLPEQVIVGEAVFRRGVVLPDGWLAYTSDSPVKTVGILPANLVLRDGRSLPYNLRVRPRRPTFSVMERLRENPPAPFPWVLPDKVATQYSALEIELKAEEGYRFIGTSQLLFGPIAIKPEVIPTGAQGVDTLTFVLDPRIHTNLRGQLTGRLTETREGGETVVSEDISLKFTLAQVPEVPVSLRVVAGKYRLVGQNVNVIERAGTPTQMQPVMATGTGASAYIEFSAVAGAPLAFQPRMLDKPLPWAGPILPQTPSRPLVEFATGDKVGGLLRWEKAVGATEYRIYRGTEGNVSLTPQNRIAVVPASEAGAYTHTDETPLEPGTVYWYRVVAVCHREGFSEELFPEKDFSAVGESSEPLLTRPAAPLTVAVAAVTVEGKSMVEVRFPKANGATHYWIYRGTTTDFAPSPENRVGDVVGSDASAYAWHDATPLTPGVTYYYKVVSVAIKEGLKERVSAPSPVSNGYTTP